MGISVFVFVVAYKSKGLKAAFIPTGIALAIFLIIFVAAIYISASAMR